MSVIFKRKNTKAGTRSRESSFEAESEEASSSKEQSPATVAAKLKKKTKLKSRLSFGADNDEEADTPRFQLKKSNLSQKLTLGTHPASPKNILPSSLDSSPRSNGGPTYDKAYLSQLKASTPTTRPPPVHDDPYDADMSMDIGDVSTRTIDVFADDPVESSIPSESSIKFAKEKRDRLRATTAAGEDDFISLSVTRRSDEPQGPHPSSRLVREEDELGEGDDEFAEYTSAQERIALGKKSKKVEASKRKTAMKELIADAEEEDEETIEWEHEQLRRGGHRTPASSPKPPTKQIYKPAPIPPTTTLPTLPASIARLAQTLAGLSTSHATNAAALATLGDDRSQIQVRDAQMRSLVARAEEKRRWFEAFREWVEGVAVFLDEKFPQLEKLEQDHISIIRERAEMTGRRRHLDDADDLSLFLGSPPPSPIPSHDQDESPEQEQETTPSTRRAARLDRRAHRRPRQPNPSPSPSSAPKSRQSKEKEEEGYSTDASLPEPDATSYQSALQDIAARKEGILGDVRAVEFRDPRVGMPSASGDDNTKAMGLAGWWAQWRELYGELYESAWGDLNLLVSWEFWVRWEVVGWDLVREKKSLDSFKWYDGLYRYSRPATALSTGDDDDDVAMQPPPKEDLVASMIATTVLPLCGKLLDAGVVDVYSEYDVRRIVDLAEEVEASIEGRGAKFNIILDAVHASFAKAIASTTTLISTSSQTQATLPFNPESIPARRRFLLRRVKLLRNLLRWRRYAGNEPRLDRTVKELVSGCLVRVATSGWDVGGEEVIREVVGLLPPDLRTEELVRLVGQSRV